MCVLKEYTIQIDAFLGLTMEVKHLIGLIMEVEIVPERVECSHIDASGFNNAPSLQFRFFSF